MPVPQDTHLWEDLLLAIEEGQVVPMVGNDLLHIEAPGEPPVYFHQAVAERLAVELGVDRAALPAKFDINDVVCADANFHGDPEDISPRVVRLLRGMKTPMPESLRLLAEIPDFHLFISTSFDTLLEEAIAAVRGRRPAVAAFPTAGEITDFDEALLATNGSMVFQILGRASASSSFAMTEGQMLEQMHDLMSGQRRPQNLIAKLQKSHLLIMGVSFPDWLSRFLLRLVREKPLWDSRPKMEVIVGDGLSQQQFMRFLQHFSPRRSRLYPLESPVEFVAELHRRWFERHPVTTAPVAAPASSEKPAEMAGGSIFLSYASEDREPVFRLANQLTGAGLEVWCDRRLQPGAEYRYLIERNIRECSGFVPVISQHALGNDERWFRREWALACERARFYFGTDRSFLFPIVIDSTPMQQLNKLEHEIFGRSAVRAEGGVAPPELIVELDEAQKGWRRQFAAAG